MVLWRWFHRNWNSEMANAQLNQKNNHSKTLTQSTQIDSKARVSNKVCVPFSPFTIPALGVNFFGVSLAAVSLPRLPFCFRHLSAIIILLFPFFDWSSLPFALFDKSSKVNSIDFDHLPKLFPVIHTRLLDHVPRHVFRHSFARQTSQRVWLEVYRHNRTLRSVAQGRKNEPQETFRTNR